MSMPLIETSRGTAMAKALWTMFEQPAAAIPAYGTNRPEYVRSFEKSLESLRDVPAA
jgi:hypothetical protein